MITYVYALELLIPCSLDHTYTLNTSCLGKRMTLHTPARLIFGDWVNMACLWVQSTEYYKDGCIELRSAL